MLVARFSAIGDVAMTVPILYNVCRANPEREFVMLTRKGYEQIFAGAPANLRVEGVELREGRYKGAAGMMRLASDEYGRHGYGVFVDLHDVLRTRLIGLWCTLRGVKVARIDKGRREKKALTRRRNKRHGALKSQLERYADAFRAAGLSTGGGFEGVFSGRGQAPADMYAPITVPKGAGERWIAVAPFAAHPGKVYPPEKMKKAVEELAQDRRNTIFLLGGGKKEEEILGSWAEGRENVRSLAGERHGFRAEMALLNHCDAAVVMDSANMHLAALAQTPTVAVWGATHADTGFGAWGADRSRYVEASMDCRPCSTFGQKACRKAAPGEPPPCLAAIDSAAIAAAVKKIIGV